MKTTKVSSRTVFIAIVAALGGILFGYDTAVISGTTGKTLEEIEEYWRNK